MSHSIRRELHLPHPPSEVWQSIADREALAEWLHPNDFEPKVGHRFTFHVPANPRVNFPGLVVHCEVLVCEPPSRLLFSWSVPGPVADTRVSFVLEPQGDGTRLLFEHAGFDLSQPRGKQAFRGAEVGWANMLQRLADRVARRPSDELQSDT
ncbi:MAG: SRPBCC family protein [Tepidisphaeraceae bacterium]